MADCNVAMRGCASRSIEEGKSGLGETTGLNKLDGFYQVFFGKNSIKPIQNAKHK
tara:strand:+ start:421 stop:585 length:165 start_codon:yes stop_codon:yes gene_type:complete